MKENRKIKIDMHAARSSDGRVIWAEISMHKHIIRDISELQRAFGKRAGLSWSLICNGYRTRLDRNDPRIEQAGFLLRIPEDMARAGMRAECELIA